MLEILVAILAFELGYPVIGWLSVVLAILSLVYISFKVGREVSK